MISIVSPRSLVFDFGGVLFPTEPYSGGETAPEERKLLTGTVQSIYKDLGTEIQQGNFSIAQFRQEFTKRIAGMSPERVTIVLRSICEPDPEILDLLQAIHDRYVVYGLINAPLGWTEIRRGLHHLDNYFKRIVVSHEIGVRKPDPKIFQYFLKVTGCQPQTTLFIDDKQENIDVAQTLGFEALRYTTAQNLRDFLRL